MKSAYELAMERLSKQSPTVKISADQKKKLAEIDSKYAAKLAEREIFLKDEMSKAAAKGDWENKSSARKNPSTPNSRRKRWKHGGRKADGASSASN